MATTHRRVRRGGIAVAVALAVASVDVPGPSADVFEASFVEAASGDTASRYAPLPSPIRVLDTRPGAPIDRLPEDSGMAIDPVTATVAAAAGVAEDDVVAVVINLTAVDADGAGFATVFPTGESVPNSSSVNTSFAGHIVANMVTARLGAGGMISIFASVGTDVLVDVQGLYVRSTSSTAGRFVAVPPTRALDTRPIGRVPAGVTATVDLSAIVPASASAAVVNVSAVGAGGDGFLTVFPPGGAVPNSSNLNYVAGTTASNQAIATLVNQSISVFTQAETDLLVDVVGYITGATDVESSAGLFVPLSPGRLLDTRPLSSPTGGAPIGPDRTFTQPVLGRAGIPSTGVAAIALNATATETTDTGFITVWENGIARPNVSAVNWVGAQQTLANHVTTDVGNGAIDIYVITPVDVVVDVTGYYTDGTVPPPAAPKPPPLDFTDTTLQGPTAQGPTPPSAGDHSFLFVSGNLPGSYGRWDPCRPGQELTFAVNAQRATQFHIDLLYEAIRRVEAATGFDFVPYQDPPITAAGLDDRRPPAGADIVFGFSDTGATPSLEGSVLGVGGGFWFSTIGEISTGFVLIDMIDLGNSDEVLTTLVHETGHMVGLDHVNLSSEVMFPFNVGVSSFGPGDRQGLWRLGTAQPCIDEPRPSGSVEPTLVERSTGR